MKKAKWPKQPKPVHMEDGDDQGADAFADVFCTPTTTVGDFTDYSEEKQPEVEYNSWQQKGKQSEVQHWEPAPVRPEPQPPHMTENQLPTLDLSRPLEDYAIAVRPASRSSSYHGDISPRAASRSSPRQARRTYRAPASDIGPRHHSPVSPQFGRRSLGPFHSPPRGAPTRRIPQPQRSFSASANAGGFMSSAFNPLMAAPVPPFIHQAGQLPPDSNAPLTGYGLLSTQLGRGDGGPSVPPLYRRFTSLQHRSLLGIQDELSVLEEQLRNCDAAESQQRRYYERDAPESRRRDYMEPNHLSHQRHQILSAINDKLRQYSDQLKVWQKATGFEDAEASEIDQYKELLVRTRLIVKSETEFLNAEDDLMTLDRPRVFDEDDSSGDETSTPSQIPQHTSGSASRPPSPKATTPRVTSGHGSTKLQRREAPRRRQDIADLKPILLGLGAAIIMPTLTFPLVPSFSGRMAVVFIAGLAVLMTFQTQAQNFSNNGRISDALLLTVVYGAVMALVAATTN